jgi:hypothetical protein
MGLSCSLIGGPSSVQVLYAMKNRFLSQVVFSGSWSLRLGGLHPRTAPGPRHLREPPPPSSCLLADITWAFRHYPLEPSPFRRARAKVVVILADRHSRNTKC